MATVVISLPPALETFAESQLHVKGHASVAESLVALVEEARSREVELDSVILEGLESGDVIPLTEKFWEDLRADAALMVDAHRTITIPG